MGYLCLCEIKKLLHNRNFVLISLFFFILTLGTKCYEAYENNMPSSKNEACQYMEQISNYSNYIEEVCKRSESIQNSTLYKESIYEGLLKEKKEVEEGIRTYSDTQISCLDKLLSISQYLKNINSDIEVHYVYSGAYEALIGSRKVSIPYQNIAITLSLCLLLVGVFVQEKKEGMYYFNHTMPNYKKIYQEKIRLVVSISIFVCIFWWIPEWVYIVQNFYIANPFAPAISVPMFSNCPSWMLLWEMVVIVCLMKVLRSIVTGLLITFASYNAENYMMAWAMSVF